MKVKISKEQIDKFIEDFEYDFASRRMKNEKEHFGHMSDISKRLRRMLNNLEAQPLEEEKKECDDWRDHAWKNTDGVLWPAGRYTTAMLREEKCIYCGDIRRIKTDAGEPTKILSSPKQKEEKCWKCKNPISEHTAYPGVPDRTECPKKEENLWCDRPSGKNCKCVCHQENYSLPKDFLNHPKSGLPPNLNLDNPTQHEMTIQFAINQLIQFLRERGIE